MSYMETLSEDEFFKGLQEKLPPVFTGKLASEMIGGLYTPRSLSNLDAAGKGPELKVMSGKSVLYEKDSFLTWLKSTVKPKKFVQRKPRTEPRHDRHEFTDYLNSIGADVYNGYH